jgi:site-specific recombinase XerD
MEAANRAGFMAYLLDELEKAPSTVRQYLYRADFIEGKLDKPLEEVTSSDLRQFKAQLRGVYSSSHIKGAIVVAHHFHQWGSLEDKWQRNGIMDVKPPKERNNSPPPLPIDKVRAILAAAQGSLEVRVTHLPSYGGLRIEEASYIGEGEWTEGWLRFAGKGDKPREVPVHPCLEAVKPQILAHPRPHKYSLQKAKERIEARLGFRFVTHQLRKSFSTALHDEGVSHLCRKDLLGHSLGLDGVYTLVSQREKIAATSCLPY